MIVGVAVEAGDMEPDLVPDRQRERALHAGHALASQPVGGGRDQGIGDGLVVDALEHAKLNECLALVFEDEIVDLRGNAPDDLAVTLGEEERGAGMLEPRVLLRSGDQPERLALERRDPVRVAAVQRPLQVDESAVVGGGRRRTDGQGHADWRCRGWPLATPPDISATHG